jgi:magnesium transporter
VDEQTQTLSSKKGLAPGTLIHVGEKKAEKTSVSIIEYDGVLYDEKGDVSVEKIAASIKRPTITWVNVAGLTQTEIIAEIGGYFHLHPLIQEDILNTTQRPKLEDFEEYLFFTIKMPIVEDGEISAEQVSIVLHNQAVLSFQEQQSDVFDTVRNRLKTGKGRMRKEGADYLAYALLDAVVDGYFEVFEKIGERIEDLEDGVLTNPTPPILERIHSLKSELIYLRKSIWPLRDVVSGLERSESKLIADSTSLYFKDVYDHVIQVADTLETYRDMVTGMLDIYLSSVSNKMNEVMKVLTIIATIFIPLTFIAGLYGMNFGNMPELGWEYGYFTALLGMLLIAIGELVYFRKKGWL